MQHPRRRPAVPVPVLTWIVLACLALPAQAMKVEQITDRKSGQFGLPALDDAGTTVLVNTSNDQFGTNPRWSWQIDSWDAASGSGSALTEYVDGVGWLGATVSVSDDGEWIAFASPADLTGENHDESLELFVMRSDGTGIDQVTDDPAVNAGSVLTVAMAGSADRIAFVANTDPLGANPDHLNQLFVVDRSGSGLTQLTGASTDLVAEDFRFGIDDAGDRVVFAHREDFLGLNPDGLLEVFAVNADGSGLRQLTATATGDSTRPSISGNGEKVAYDSSSFPGGPTSVHVVDWIGTGRRLLDSGGSWPSITDDGLVVVYARSGEIYRINSDGTGKTALTPSADSVFNERPVVSGSGGRIAFTSYAGEYPGGDNPDGGPELTVMDGSGGNVLQLTVVRDVPDDPVTWSPDITTDGSRIVFNSSPSGATYRIQADGSDLFRVTSFGTEEPSVSGDGETIVFSSIADPLGQNPNNDELLFAIQADGTNVRQLTDYQGCGLAIDPVISADGSFVVFQSCDDFTGGNPDHSVELFRVRPDGTDMLQLTSDEDDTFKWPRVDENGGWVVFQSLTDFDGENPDLKLQVLRVKTDGTGLQRVTSDPDYHSWAPDVSGSGERIVYASEADPLGTNADHNYEIFVRDVSTDTTRQLTFTTEGGNNLPRISKNGRFVYFTSDAPIFESDPSRPYDAYRVDVDTGAIERAGALRRGPASLEPWGSMRLREGHVAVDGSGARAAFSAAGDWAGRNPDYNRELYLVDQEAPVRFEPGRASPTVLSWDPEPAPLRYDVVRGEVASLAIVGDTVDLGPVECLENDSPDTDTEGSGDPEDPDPGEAFFFLYRGSQGLAAGPGSYGKGSGDRERVAGSGDCPP